VGFFLLTVFSASVSAFAGIALDFITSG